MENRKISLNDKEITKLHEFKKKISDVIETDHDDYYLTKWLKARGFNVKKAEEMYRTSLAFRQTWDVKNIYKHYQIPEVLQQYLAGGICGYDKEGSPVRIELFGRLDLYGLLHSCRKSDLVRTKLHQCEDFVERWKEQSKQRGQDVDGIIVIFDMEGVTTKLLWPPGLKMYLYLVKILEDNYPEVVKKMFVVNAPSYFQLFWTVCQPLVSEDMKKKITVCGKDHQSTLLAQIDAEELPQFLGGTKVGPGGDPRCSDQICQGGDVPANYYLWENMYADTMETAEIAPGHRHSVKHTVTRPGSILRWEFSTRSHDVGFGVTYRSTESTDADIEEDIIPKERIKCNLVTEDGSLKCDKPGVYSLIFDNKYSWMVSKTVYYKVQLDCAKPRES